MNEVLQQFADTLYEAALSAPMLTLLPEGDVAAVYAVQRMNPDRLLAAQYGQRLEPSSLVMADVATAATALKQDVMVRRAIQHLGSTSFQTTRSRNE
jgi:hypothetical protein